MPEEESKPEIQMNFEGPVGTAIGKIVHQPPKPLPVGIPQNLPRTDAKEFVGRDEVMERLHEQLQRTERVAITSVTGMGGIGKTELALQYARRFLEKAYPGGACWLEGRGVDVAVQFLSFAKSRLDLNPSEEWNLKERVDYCWQHWKPEGKVLVVFDDVQEYETIEGVLPSDGRFKVLVTTRKQKWKSFQRLELPVLAEEAALQLLVSFVGEERIEREWETAKALCADVGYLPLALELVGRYLAKKRDLSLLKMRERLGLEHRSLQDRSAEMTAERGVAAAFELSWQELVEEEKELGRLLSLFAPAPITWSWVETIHSEVDEEDLEDWQEGLVGLSLLQRVEEGRYQLHPLIRQFFQLNFLELDKTKLLENVAYEFAKIVKTNPFYAFNVLNNSMSYWSFEIYNFEPDAMRIENLFRVAMESCSVGIGCLSKLVMRLNEDGNLPGIDVEFFDTKIDETNLRKCLITFNFDNPDIVDRLGLYYQPQVSWVWQKNFQIITKKLSTLVIERRIPVSESYLSFEAAWHGALYVTGIRSPNFQPIRIDEIESRLDKLEISKASKMIQFCISQLEDQLNKSRSQDETYLTLPSTFRSFCETDIVSPEIVLEYVEDVYQKAIDSYQQLLDTWFSYLVAELQLASILPAKIVGVVTPPKHKRGSVSISWCWVSLPKGSKNSVDFELGDQRLLREDYRLPHLSKKIVQDRLHLRDCSEPIHPYIHMREDSLGWYPVTKMVYRWLWHDLERIG
ncbi:NB-ARC domain-containing protein [Roseofilum sp. SBFL]|nr:NB-ARC domain-containing protein [Roseofilum sp. SBFL]